MLSQSNKDDLAQKIATAAQSENAKELYQVLLNHLSGRSPSALTQTKTGMITTAVEHFRSLRSEDESVEMTALKKQAVQALRDKLEFMSQTAGRNKNMSLDQLATDLEFIYRVGMFAFGASNQGNEDRLATLIPASLRKDNFYFIYQAIQSTQPTVCYKIFAETDEATQRTMLDNAITWFEKTCESKLNRGARDENQSLVQKLKNIKFTLPAVNLPLATEFIYRAGVSLLEPSHAKNNTRIEQILQAQKDASTKRFIGMGLAIASIVGLIAGAIALAVVTAGFSTPLSAGMIGLAVTLGVAVLGAIKGVSLAKSAKAEKNIVVTRIASTLFHRERSAVPTVSSDKSPVVTSFAVKV